LRKTAHSLCTATVSTVDIKEELTETAVRNWLHGAECFWRSWQVLSWSKILLWKATCHCRIHKTTLRVPILNQINPIQAQSHFLTIYFNIFLPSMPWPS